MQRKRVLFFVKYPERGGVKSRLSERLGEHAALDLYKCFVRDILAMLAKSGYPVTICFTPSDAAGRTADWLGTGYAYAPQKGGGLGERMSTALEEAFSAGDDAAVLIGSDIPDLPQRILDEAFSALERVDAVIGPAEDGGYYLVGFRREAFLPALFDGIPWSTDRVLAATLALLRERGRTVRVLSSWRDVDTLEDLRALDQRLRNGSGEAPFTRGCIAAVLNKQD